MVTAGMAVTIFIFGIGSVTAAVPSAAPISRVAASTEAGASQVLVPAATTPTTGATLPVNTESHGGRVAALIALVVLALGALLVWNLVRRRNRARAH